MLYLLCYQQNLNNQKMSWVLNVTRSENIRQTSTKVISYGIKHQKICS